VYVILSGVAGSEANGNAVEESLQIAEPLILSPD
jgi:hypothetical protein